MLRIIRTVLWCACLGAMAAQAQADAKCEALHARADAQPGFVPPLGAQVVGTGRARLYTAPDTACDSGRFLIPKDRVTVYTPYRSWVRVMFIHPKTGEDTTAWMPENRLRITGKMGPG